MYIYVIFDPNQVEKPQGNKVVQYFEILNSLWHYLIPWPLELVLAFSPGLFHFQVPGLLDFFGPGTTGPRDLQGL